MMVVLKYDTSSFGCMKLFQQITRAVPLGCIDLDEAIVFFTDKTKVGMAVGKQGANIKILRERFKKQVFIISNATDPLELSKNFFYQPKVDVSYADHEHNIIQIKFENQKDRRNFLANDRLQLKVLKSIISKQAPNIKNIIVPIIANSLSQQVDN